MASGNVSSLRAEGEWFESAEMVMKGIGLPSGENTTSNESQELDFALTPELGDAYFEEGEQQMTQEEIDDAYSEYINDQHRQDEEMDEAMISNPKSKMWCRQDIDSLHVVMLWFRSEPVQTMNRTPDQTI